MIKKVNSYTLSQTQSDPFLVILISGGFRSGFSDSTSVELFDPVTAESCELPALPSDRTHHTQDGPLLCGGSWPGHNQQAGILAKDQKYVLKNVIIISLALSRAQGVIMSACPSICHSLFTMSVSAYQAPFPSLSQAFSPAFYPTSSSYM